MTEFTQKIDGIMILVKAVEDRMIRSLNEGQMRFDVLQLMTATLQAMLQTLEYQAGDERESFAVKAGMGEFKAIIDRLLGRMESLQSEVDT